MKDPKGRAPRRAWLTVLLLGVLLLTGAAAVKVMAPEPPPRPRPRAPSTPPGWLPPVDLPAADGGVAVRLPDFEGPTVMHVWLQGCADCAPAFEAARRHHEAGVSFGARVVNVAYGRVDADFARAHGLTENLAIDPGSAVVGPLGIGTFTTIVLDENGWVRHMDYPHEHGYVERVRAAVEEAATPRPAPRHAATAPTYDPSEPLELRDVVVWSAAGLGLSLVLLGLGWGAALVPWAALLRPAPPAPARVLGQEVGVQAEQRCPYCHAGVSEWDWVVRCEGCATVYHEECAGDLSRCSSLGCGRPVSGRQARERA